ncbi:F-box protein GID2 [Cornus florida]|uniref:F-box protein GID2 n=1 Tax=Cornus florida TaxID=4283 RepID=UPI002898304F|nr:F-box protein GID2 [Cornus florida]
MKRSIATDVDPVTGDDKKMKKIKIEEEEEEEEPKKSSSVLMDENLLYEVLKHVDALTLATAACVSKQWHTTAQDERLWELICTRHWANTGCGSQQLRSVVLALGGFRRLHSLYLWPLSKPPSSSSSSSSSSASSSSAWPCLPPPPRPAVPAKPATAKTRWGKDEVHLSLSLLSIRYYEKMNFNNRSK